MKTIPLKTIRPISKEKTPQAKSCLFNTPKILDIEIGCGVGWHPIQYATKNPDRFLIAIEHTRTRFSKFFRRWQNHQLSNLLPIHDNAISWITHNVQPHSVDRYFILYPNPNPKEKHLNKRWYAMPFTHVLINTLKPGGKLHLATNENFYARESELYFCDHWQLKLLNKNVLSRQNTNNFRTHFEKKYILADGLCYDLIFEKPANITPY